MRSQAGAWERGNRSTRALSAAEVEQALANWIAQAIAPFGSDGFDYFVTDGTFSDFPRVFIDVLTNP